jgi:hypothetical protein
MPPGHYLIVHFTKSHVFGLVLRKWLHSDTRAYYPLDSYTTHSRARNALDKLYNHDIGSTDWDLYDINICIMKEGDTYVPLVFDKLKAALEAYRDIWTNTLAIREFEEIEENSVVTKQKWRDASVTTMQVNLITFDKFMIHDLLSRPGIKYKLL